MNYRESSASKNLKSAAFQKETLWLVLIIAGLMITGCATTSVDEKGRVVIHNFGYVKIVKPPVYPDINEINVTGATLIGFSVGDGFTIGYKEDETIRVPLNCKILIVVKDASQFKHLLDEITTIKGEDICATVSPD